MKSLWEWALMPISTASLAVISIITRKLLNNRPLISERKIKKHNDFNRTVRYFLNEDSQRISINEKPTDEDKQMNIELFKALIEAVCKLDLYDVTDRYRVNWITGVERKEIEPLQIHTDISIKDGIGHIIIEPSREQMKAVENLTDKQIYYTLEKIGLVGWDVERLEMGYKVLFILKDKSRSNAYDFNNREIK